MERFSFKGGFGIHGTICVLRCLKEELAWATDERLWVSSIIMLFKTVIPLQT